MGLAASLLCIHVFSGAVHPSEFPLYVCSVVVNYIHVFLVGAPFGLFTNGIYVYTCAVTRPYIQSYFFFYQRGTVYRPIVSNSLRPLWIVIRK